MLYHLDFQPNLVLDNNLGPHAFPMGKHFPMGNSILPMGNQFSDEFFRGLSLI